MPAPIMPAPSTATFLGANFVSTLGRAAPLPSASIEPNSVRTIARACGVIAVRAKYRLSMRNAASMGTCKPS